MPDDCFLASQFGTPVDTVRICGGFLRVRSMTAAVKNIVGGNLNHFTTYCGNGFCQITGCLMIEQVAEFCFAFGLVDSSKGGTVDDGLDGVTFDVLSHRIGIADVKFFFVGKKDAVCLLLLPDSLLQFVSQLAAASCY